MKTISIDQHEAELAFLMHIIDLKDETIEVLEETIEVLQRTMEA